MDKIIVLAIQLAVAVAAFALGKYVFPNIPKSVSKKIAGTVRLGGTVRDMGA